MILITHLSPLVSSEFQQKSQEDILVETDWPVSEAYFSTGYIHILKSYNSKQSS